MNKVLLRELLQLSPAERREIAQELWDSLEPQDLPPLSEDQIEDFERRLAEYRANPDSASPWQEAKERLLARYK
jgi:putative addiction module component (TIGR02574 family)